MKVLDTEKNIGVEVFYTPYDGIQGKLRKKPEDFVVRENSIYPDKKTNGKFTIAEVTSTNWETNTLVRELSKRLHISRQRISFAGTKDKRAKTTQLMSFYNVSIEKLLSVKIKEVEIKNVYLSDKKINMGSLRGNSFKIIVRDINEQNIGNIEKIAQMLLDAGGFPNFYGIQRFGIVRPTTHIVGRYLVKGDFEKAVMSYIANPVSGEDEKISFLRKKLEETKDYADALKHFPDVLNFEKAILNKLVVNPWDFVSALKELPKNLLTMFIYAYQAYLFNRILSERIRRKLPISQAVEGDIVIPFRRDVFEEEYIRVSGENIEKVNTQIRKGKAFISGLLVGSDSVFADGEMGEIEHRIIEAEKIDTRDFIIPEIPFISSSGSRRPLLAVLKNFSYRVIDDVWDTNKKAVSFEFTLLKGCYATSLLREFMKADEIKNY